MPYEEENTKDCYTVQDGIAGALPWRQTRGWGLEASASLVHLPVGPPPTGRTIVQCGLGRSHGCRGHHDPIPGQGIWLEIVGLTSMHSLDCGT